MSTRTHIARSVRASSENQVKLPFETTPNRTLFSAMGVLIGTGVVAIAFGSPEAQARSALDDMAWAPQQSQLTQSAAAADGGTAGAVALSRAMTPGGVRAEPAAYAVPAAYAAPFAALAVQIDRVYAGVRQRLVRNDG